MRAPLPTLVQNNVQDSLFTMPEMERADKMMAQVFKKANAADRYRCTFYPGLINLTNRCRPRLSIGSIVGLSSSKTSIVRHLIFGQIVQNQGKHFHDH